SLLLSHGADADYSKDNLTPLMFAAKNGNINIARLLISYGADVNKTNGDSTALMYATQECHADIIELLIQNQAEIPQSIAARIDFILSIYTQNTGQAKRLLHANSNKQAAKNEGLIFAMRLN